MRRIDEDLPELYQRLFPEFFKEEIPEETLTTCNDCAMCSRPDQPKVPGQDYFRPDTKCCTFHPKLPNYLVGGLLLDSNPAMDWGRQVIREKIERRISVTPTSIFPPKKFMMLHKFGGERAFGKNQSLVCPYYVKNGGLCGIWKFREAVCTTFFCKPVAGVEGKKFWNVLRGYLIQAQDALGWYALLQLNWDVEVLWEFGMNFGVETLDSLDMDDQPPADEDYRKLWGDWAGREEEFYKKTYEIVSALTREDFDRISGMNQQLFLSWLRKNKKEVVSPTMPELLKANPDMKAFPAADGSFVIKTEAGFFTVLAALFDVVQMFDSKRTVDDVRAMVLEKWEVPLEDELLFSMFQNRMIIPA